MRICLLEQLDLARAHRCRPDPAVCRLHRAAGEFFAFLPENALPVGKVSLGWVLLFYGLLFGLTCFGGRIKSWLAGRIGHKPGCH